VCQDWGGLLGLRLVAEAPERFRGLVAANTGLPDGSLRMPPIWWRFREVVETVEVLDVGQLVAAGVQRGLSDAERAAYDAPFPSEAHKAGARAMPGLVPQDPADPGAGDNVAAWKVLRTLDLPVVTAFSDGDPITRGGEALLQAGMPGAAGQPHVTLPGGHFLQEDCPGELAAITIDLVRRTAG
jgi:haloalkane dehalogenase